MADYDGPKNDGMKDNATPCADKKMPAAGVAYRKPGSGPVQAGPGGSTGVRYGSVSGGEKSSGDPRYGSLPAMPPETKKGE